MEKTLSFGNQRAVVSDLGASLRQYYLEPEGGGRVDLIWGYSGDENKKAGQGDILMPFPSRIRQGRYRFNGREHQLPINDKEGPNAIHGFFREMTWKHEMPKPSTIRFELDLRKEDLASRGYPFSLNAQLLYRLDRFGLTCEFSLRNTGDELAPVGAGFHPYFQVGTPTIDEARLKLPATRYLEFTDLIPTGRILDVQGSPNDFLSPRTIGPTKFNFCFTDLLRDSEGLAWAELSSPRTGIGIKVWMDRAFPYLVIYSGDAIPGGDARKSLAIEPMTCATDAFNHPDWGLAALEPGQTLSGRFGVRPSAP